MIEELLAQFQQNPNGRCLVVMPIYRLVFDEPFRVGEFCFFPPDSIDLDDLCPIPNRTLDDMDCKVEGEGNDQFVVINAKGQALRELQSGATGFDLQVLENAHSIAFIAPLDSEAFFNATHQEDIALIKNLSAMAERALDVIRFDCCQFYLPETLPGAVGSWGNSGDWLGALIYVEEKRHSRLIAGAAVESTAVVRGIGLEIDDGTFDDPPAAEEGEVAGVAIHALSLYSEVMTANTETVKFTRAMTLLQFLATPDEYCNWKNQKGDIACHVATTKHDYHVLMQRLTALSSQVQNSQQSGYRTLIVHHGKLLPELIPSPEGRRELFQDLQRYCSLMIDDMLENRTMCWADYLARREQLKKALGVA